MKRLSGHHQCCVLCGCVYGEHETCPTNNGVWLQTELCSECWGEEWQAFRVRHGEVMDDGSDGWDEYYPLISGQPVKYFDIDYFPQTRHRRYPSLESKWRRLRWQQIIQKQLDIKQFLRVLKLRRILNP